MKYIIIRNFVYGIFALCILAVFTSVADAQTAKGTVYHDVNKNNVIPDSIFYNINMT